MLFVYFFFALNVYIFVSTPPKKKNCNGLMYGFGFVSNGFAANFFLFFPSDLVTPYWFPKPSCLFLCFFIIMSPPLSISAYVHIFMSIVYFCCCTSKVLCSIPNCRIFLLGLQHSCLTVIFHFHIELSYPLFFGILVGCLLLVVQFITMFP